ncbi:hypothetical protein [Bosea sp. FBZP-16]|uniref:hypothetical protein n=1 Tax=Bosea sp. FBZP-16 TaxID=2065382 RepID=UPI000C302CAF|nr:hypothetical protein [Bosea sp. FBZP-16]
MRTDEQKAKHREEQRLYRARYPEKVKERNRKYLAKHGNSDGTAFRKFVWRQENREHVAATLKAWKAANPGHDANRARWKTSAAAREKQKQRWRCRYLASVVDREALASRIAANIEAVVPRTLPADARSAVIAAMAEAIYNGAITTRPTKDDAKHHIASYFRTFTRFGPVSLDAPRFDDGRGSYHDVVSEGLWQ